MTLRSVRNTCSWQASAECHCGGWDRPVLTGTHPVPLLLCAQYGFCESEIVTIVHTGKYLWNYAISTARLQSLRHTVCDCVPAGYVMQQSVFSPWCDMSSSGLRWEEFSVYSSEQLWLTHQTWQLKWKLWLRFSGWQHCIYHRICAFFLCSTKTSLMTVGILQVHVLILCLVSLTLFLFLFPCIFLIYYYISNITFHIMFIFIMFIQPCVFFPPSETTLPCFVSFQTCGGFNKASVSAVNSSRKPEPSFCA